MIHRDCIHHYYEKDENYHLDMCKKHPEMIWGVDSFTCEGCTSYISRNYEKPLKQIPVNLTPSYKTLRYEVKIFFADEKNLLQKKIFYTEKSVLEYIADIREKHPLYDYSVYRVDQMVIDLQED